MPYVRTRRARRGMSGLGGYSWVNTGTTQNPNYTCRDDNSGAIVNYDKCPQQGVTSSGGSTSTWGKITDFLSSAGSGALNFYGQQQMTAGALAAQQSRYGYQPGPPPWLLPVGLLGLGVVAVVVLSKKKGS